MTARHGRARRGLRPAALRLIILATVFGASSARADDWSYTLRPGDDLWRIAQRFCGEIGSAAKIAQHNGISDPALVRAGQRINIPTDWLVFEPATAKVIAITGSVSISRGTSRNVQQVSARIGDVLRMGHLLTTGEGSALVEFADGSILVLKPDSEVLFNKLTAFGPAGMVDTHLRFAYGRGTATVQPQNQGDRFRIATPEGVAAVRGTEFRIGHQGGGDDAVSNTETLEGRVEFEAAGQTADLPSGYGVAVSGTSVVREALLEAPVFENGPQTGAATQTTSGGELSWRALAGASRYIATWSEASAPGTVAAQRLTNEPRLTVDVPTGNYDLAVRGVSASGVEGFDATQRLAVVDPGPLNLSTSGDIGGDVTFAWEFPAGAPASAVSITLAADHWEEARKLSATGTTHTVHLAPGSYRWRVQQPSSAPSPEARFRLRPATPENLVAESARRTLTVSWDSVANAQGYALKVTPTAGTREAIARELSAGTTSASIEVPAFGTYRIAVEAIANGQRSVAATTEDRVQRRPWWLLVVGAVILSL